ncbi:hypothetical protein YB2330_000990 [Saitoella coloradoensis]
MARGKQKEAAQEKARKVALAKQGGQSQLGARAAGLTCPCPVCKSGMANYKILVTHMTAKHPTAPVPPQSDFPGSK